MLAVNEGKKEGMRVNMPDLSGERPLSPPRREISPPKRDISPPRRDMGRSLFLLPIDSIRPNPDQPRREFSREELQELTLSIAQIGLIQPLTVRPGASGYVLICGERRLRACQLLGLKEVPCIVEQVTGEQSALMAMVENVQRADLSFWEEAEGYRRLLTVYGIDREELCRRIGKSAAFLANQLRLLTKRRSCGWWTGSSRRG